MFTKFTTLVCALVLMNISYGQNNKQIAQEKADLAVKMMDNGQIEESIKLLEECIKLDPENISFTYEMAYAYYQKKEYKSAKKHLQKVVKHKDATSAYYQLLGNSFDMMGKQKDAIKTYDKGLERFPSAGNLFLEKGNIYLINKQYGEALAYYDLGIQLNPSFRSNYYRAALVYLNSSEEVWGMLYGEIFMNLELNSDRTANMSKSLYNTYKSEIRINGDSSKVVSFSKNNTVDVSDLNDVKLPFPTTVYEPALLMSILDVKSIDLASLNVIRNRFVDYYFNNKFNEKYPNILFDYHKKLKDSGHFEAYNYWLLKSGDQEAFYLWKAANKDKWDAFVKWYADNRMVVDENNLFFRRQY